jgi:SRSO17 transposase
MLTYETFFRSHRRPVLDHARTYIRGLLQPDLRKNVERIANDVPGGNVQNLQQFVSSSKWDASAVMRQTALNANELLGHASDSCLLIDESGFPKKGKASVGVARQWLGCVGKTDNGQVGVFAGLCNGHHSQLVNARLYLPECWTDDVARCERVGIPEAHRRFRTKEELALELVDDAVEQGLRFGWVGADAGYGKGLSFMLALEQKNMTFAVDVHRNQMVFLNRPRPQIPDRKSSRGRTPSRYTVNENPVRVDEWAASVSERQWERIKTRDSTKGDLVYDVLCKRIFVWDEELGDKPRMWWLVVRRNAESKKDYKYTFINASSKTPKQ